MVFNKVSAPFAVVAAAVLAADLAHSVGLGRATQRAVLGETLAVSVPVRLEAGEDLSSDCVAADVFFGDDKLAPQSVLVTLDLTGSEPLLRIGTRLPVSEPVVTVYAVVGCQAKISRKFVAFADPPVALAMVSTEPSVTDPALPMGGAAAKPGRALRKPAAGGVATTGPVSGSAASVAAAPLRQPATLSAVARGGPPERERGSARISKEPARTAAKLVLDPAETDALSIPSLQWASQITVSSDSPEVVQRRAAAAALWAAMNASPEQQQKDRERLAELEQRLGALQLELAAAKTRALTAAAPESLTWSRLLEQRAVLALMAVCAALVTAVAWLGVRQHRARQAEQQWWQLPEDEAGAPVTEAKAPPEEALPETNPDRAAVRPVAQPTTSEPQMAPEAAGRAPDRPGSPLMRTGANPLVPDLTRTAFTPVHPMNAPALESVREISVEELIDLEQQAEFFVVLGQDDAAVELLESHLQTAGAVSPLPYLKLLETYRRLARRGDYERTREEFNGRFNAYAPSWDADPREGHSLEDYPGVILRLQKLWSAPHRAMDVIDASLTRAEQSHETFDLPAYRELLFLYSVARDLAERDMAQRQPVELSFPSDDSEFAPTTDFSMPNLEPLMATRPVRALPEATPLLSVDLALDELMPEEPASPPVPAQDRGNSIEFEDIDFRGNHGHRG